MIYEMPSEVTLMCLKSPDGPQSSAKTFDRLESALSTLKGRKFYGLVKSEGVQDDYFACVKIEEEDDPKSLGFERIVLSKGKYDREMIAEWERNVDLIPEIFGKMEARNIVDNNRFSVEYYRSQRELFLMLPIK